MPIPDLVGLIKTSSSHPPYPHTSPPVHLILRPIKAIPAMPHLLVSQIVQRIAYYHFIFITHSIPPIKKRSKEHDVRWHNWLRQAGSSLVKRHRGIGENGLEIGNWRSVKQSLWCCMLKMVLPGYLSAATFRPAGRSLEGWRACEEPSVNITMQRAHPRCRVTGHERHQTRDFPHLTLSQNIHDSHLRSAMDSIQIQIWQNWSEKGDVKRNFGNARVLPDSLCYGIAL